MSLFLDESGKTGTQRYTGKWNFENQSYFALCGFLIPEKNLGELNASISELCISYKIPGEIKATKKTVRKNNDNLIRDIYAIQEKLNCELFVEIVNKKFCIAKMITDYCIFPYNDWSSKEYNSYEANLLRRNFANYIYDFISDKLLGEYVEFFDGGEQNILKLKELCLKLIDEANNEAINEFISETINSFMNHEALGLLQRHVFPIVDFYKGNISVVAVSPHIDSFNNLLNRVKDKKGLIITHDKVTDLEDALKSIVEKRSCEYFACQLQFANSREVPAIQLADFWCGNIKDSVQRVLSNESELNLILRTLVQTRVNFVSSFSEQKKLFPSNFEIEQWRIWYQGYFKK